MKTTATKDIIRNPTCLTRNSAAKLPTPPRPTSSTRARSNRCRPSSPTSSSERCSHGGVAAAAAASPSSRSGCDMEPAEARMVALPVTGTVVVAAVVVVVVVVAAVAAAGASESFPRDWDIARASCRPPLEGPGGTMRPCRQLLLNGRGEGRADVMLHALRRVPATRQLGCIWNIHSQLLRATRIPV